MPDYWSVPLNTAGIDALDDTIAKGQNYSWIGNLADDYFKGQNQRYTQNQRDAFKNGLPRDANGNIDWSQVTDTLAKVGGTPQVSNLVGLQKLDLAREAMKDTAGDPAASQPSTAQFPPSASRTVTPQAQPNAAQPTSSADVPSGTPAAPGQNLTGPGKTITGVDYGPVQTSGGGITPRMIADRTGGDAQQIASGLGVSPDEVIDPSDPATRAKLVQTIRYTQANPQGEPTQGAPQAPALNAPQMPAPQAPQMVAQAQPQSTQPAPTVQGPQGNINEATAARYEAIANAYFKKGAALSAVDPAMGARYQAAGEAAAKNAQIIRGALAKNAETTPEMKNAAASGEPTPTAYEQSSGFAKKTGEGYAAQYQAIRKNANDAAVEKPQLDLVKQEMADPNFYSGTAEGLNLAYKKALVALGGDPNAAQPQEALRKIVSNSILSQIRSMAGTGQIRVAEIKIMQKAAANPDTSPAANRLLVEIASRLSDRSLALDQMARGYKGGKIDQGFDNQAAAYDKQHPLFSKDELKDPRLIAPPIFKSPQDVARANLPSGSPFQTPDGRTKYVP